MGKGAESSPAMPCTNILSENQGSRLAGVEGGTWTGCQHPDEVWA